MHLWQLSPPPPGEGVVRHLSESSAVQWAVVHSPLNWNGTSQAIAALQRAHRPQGSRCTWPFVAAAVDFEWRRGNSSGCVGGGGGLRIRPVPVPPNVCPATGMEAVRLCLSLSLSPPSLCGLPQSLCRHSMRVLQVVHPNDRTHEPLRH